MRLDKPKTGAAAASLWLPEFDEGRLQEAERLNVILPLIKWCVEHNKLTEELSDELYLYFEDLQAGRLDRIFESAEEEKAVKGDLTKAYKQVFEE